MSLTGRGFFPPLPPIANNLNPSYLQQLFPPTYDILRQVKWELLPPTTLGFFIAYGAKINFWKLGGPSQHLYFPLICK